MPMQMAMLLAALCSSSMGVFAFQLPAPRPRFGSQQRQVSRLASVVFQQQQRAIQGVRSATVGAPLYGVNVGSSGAEEIKVRRRGLMDKFLCCVKKKRATANAA